jgi:hypothetical protein
VSNRSTELAAAEPAWDETNAPTAFQPGNRRGTSIPGQLRQALGSLSPKAEQAAAVGNSNYQLKVPVVRLPGRGLDLVLDLTFASSGEWSACLTGDWAASFVVEVTPCVTTGILARSAKVAHTLVSRKTAGGKSSAKSECRLCWSRWVRTLTVRC